MQAFQGWTMLVTLPNNAIYDKEFKGFSEPIALVAFT